MLRRTAIAVIALAIAPPAHASFHLIEFSRVMTGFNGNAAIQAVELRMLTGGQQFVNTGMIRAYDSTGVLLGTLGTFSADVAVGTTDRRILCATAAFQSTFGIAADLTITAGLPVRTGQVSFEELGCLVNAIAYGNVSAPKNGTTSATALPKDLAYVLVRTVTNGQIPSCPVQEDAAARMALQSGNSAAPITFTNNAGASVNVFSTLTGAESPAPSPRVSIYPNPVRSTARVTAPGRRRLTIHDVQGRTLRTLVAGGIMRLAMPDRLGDRYEEVWDGTDARGALVPSGVYFLRYESPSGPVDRRFVVIR